MTDEAEDVTIENVTCKRETEKALLLIINNNEIWVPKSQVCDNSEVYKKDTDGDLVITAWFAGKEGLS